MHWIYALDAMHWIQCTLNMHWIDTMHWIQCTGNMHWICALDTGPWTSTSWPCALHSMYLHKVHLHWTSIGRSSWLPNGSNKKGWFARPVGRFGATICCNTRVKNCFISGNSTLLKKIIANIGEIYDYTQCFACILHYSGCLSHLIKYIKWNVDMLLSFIFRIILIYNILCSEYITERDGCLTSDCQKTVIFNCLHSYFDHKINE